MQTTLKKNVIYKTFINKKKLQEFILNMILNSKTDKILYKGDPRTINYKVMKKVMLDNYTQRIDPDFIKKEYEEIVNSFQNQKYCIIFKC